MTGIYLALAMTVSTAATNTYLEDWHDAARNRTVPVRIFLPEAEKSPCPVMLLSHGLGGSREGFGYLGSHWSEHGYVVVVMQHPGSDISIHRDRKPGERPREIMRQAVTPENAENRYNDVRFVLDELERREKENPGRFDLARIGIGGHSFGSQTALAAIGRFPYKADPRLKLGIVFSPNKTKTGDQRRIHASIRVPVLHLTGTKDDSPLQSGFDPVDRQIPFRSIAGPDQYLVVFDGGNHMLFSGHPRPLGLTTMEKQRQPLIAEMTRKFLDAYLRDEAKDRLRTELPEMMAEMMQGIGTVEMKRKNE